MYVTHEELVELLKNKTEVLGVVVDMVSTPQMIKTGNPYKDKKITKSITLEGTIGKNYNAEKTLVTEGEYVAKPRTWGTLINPYIIEHKGNYYLQVFVTKSSEPVYKIDDVVCDYNVLKEWMRERPTSSESDIIIRDIKFENIKNLTIIEKFETSVNHIEIEFVV
jgi:hypothetical protein